MYHVALDPRPVRDLPLDDQLEIRQLEMERLDRDVPIAGVMRARNIAVYENGNPFHNPFDLALRWERVGDPRLPLGPKFTRERPGILEPIIFGFRLFSGLSEDDETLHVAGPVDSLYGDQKDGFDVVTHQLPNGALHEWTVRHAEAKPRSTQYDVLLRIGERALTLVTDEPATDEAEIRFRTTSLSDASMTREADKKTFSRQRLKELFTVVDAFDVKYGHLGLIPVPAPAAMPAAAPAV